MATGAQSYPAPVGGLNDRDSLATMPPQDAVVLENWWPYPSQVMVRKGSVNWFTPYAAATETIVEYAPVGGGNKLFAASGTSIYDITSQGSSTAVVTGQSNARWQDISITNAGGSFLYLFNGVDKPQLYDGTTWQAVDNASVPFAITGVTTTNLVQACLWKNRIVMAERNTLKAWYLPVQSVGGAASALDIGAVAQRGGSIVGVYNWTIDGGAGVDDQLVFLTSNGEVIVYQGTDPASAATFALVGVYYIGRPIGRRCACKFRGDILIICEEGVFPLSQALQSSSVDRRVAITDKIQNSISIAAQLYKANFGWQLEVFQDQNMLILNIPAGNGMNYQFAQNTITGAWTKFTGWNASAWKNTFSAGLLYGDSTTVKKAWVADVDVDQQIVADGLSSFQYFQAQTYGKLFTMVRPYLTTNGSPSILYSLNINQVLSEPTGSLSYTAPTGMVWGDMYWGSMFWGGGLTPITNWHTVGAFATSAGIRLKVQGNGSEVNWSSTDYVYKAGGLL